MRVYPSVRMSSVSINRPSHKYKVQLRSFNPSMFTIFDTNRHHQRQHRQRPPPASITAEQDLFPQTQYRSSTSTRSGEGGSANTTTTVGAKQYLSSKQQQHQTLTAGENFVLIRDKIQLITNRFSPHQSSPLLLVNDDDDREKARPIILAIDDNGNDVDDSNCNRSFKYASSAGSCHACLQQGARKNIYTPHPPAERTNKHQPQVELRNQQRRRRRRLDTLLLPCDSQSTQDEQQQNNYAPGSASLLLLPSPGTTTTDLNNQNSLQSGESAAQCNGRKKYNKRSLRFRRNHSRRFTRPVKETPTQLVGLLSKHVIQAMIPSEMIGQEMELRLAWPSSGTTAAPKSIHRNSEIVFRIAGGAPQVSTDVGEEGKVDVGVRVIGKRDRVEGGRLRPGSSALNVMDCALQLFNSRDCNDFLYFTIQRDLHAASSGNRYNMSWHEFPRGTTESQNTSTTTPPPPPLPTSPRLPKGRSALQRQRKMGERRRFRVGHSDKGDYFETAEKTLQVLCHSCRVRISPQLKPEFQRVCLGCDNTFGVYRRDRSFLDERDVEFRAELRSRQQQALIDVRTLLIQFNVHLYTRMAFFSGMGSTCGTRFANLFNIDVQSSGLIEFHFHVAGANRYVRFLCRGGVNKIGDSVKGVVVVYEMSFRLLARTEKSSELVGFHVAKFAYRQGSCPETIPEYLVSYVE